MIAVCGMALLAGDRTARTVSISTAFVWLASAVTVGYADVGNPLYAAIALDIFFLLILGAATYFSRRIWPVVCLMAHAIGLAVHVSYVFEVEITVFLYYAALSVSSCGVLIPIGYGTWQAWRERVVEEMSAPQRATAV